MKRQIIKIDREKCDGCGLCIPDCPEGAIQMIDGKATLIGDLFCDGLGACIGTCPTGAIDIEEREAEPYDERKVIENIVRQGPNVIRAHLRHLEEHGETEILNQALNFLKANNISIPLEKESGKHACGNAYDKPGCPGAALRDMRESRHEENMTRNTRPDSSLRNWPVQLKLMNPHASYLRNAAILVASDCVPFAYADFHQRLLKDKIMINFCPKLDSGIQEYIEKLGVIFRDNTIRSVTVVHMEVPCCLGTVRIIQEALKVSQKIIPLREYRVSISGEII